MCVRAGALGGLKRASDPLEKDLQEVMSQLVEELGTELGSSARAVCALNC